MLRWKRRRWWRRPQQWLLAVVVVVVVTIGIIAASSPIVVSSSLPSSQQEQQQKQWQSTSTVSTAVAVASNAGNLPRPRPNHYAARQQGGKCQRRQTIYGGRATALLAEAAGRSRLLESTNVVRFLQPKSMCKAPARGTDTRVHSAPRLPGKPP